MGVPDCISAHEVRMHVARVFPVNVRRCCNSVHLYTAGGEDGSLDHGALTYFRFVARADLNETSCTDVERLHIFSPQTSAMHWHELSRYTVSDVCPSLPPWLRQPLVVCIVYSLGQTCNRDNLQSFLFFLSVCAQQSRNIGLPSVTHAFERHRKCV